MICTYLTESEFKNWTKVSDKELDETFQEVRTIFGDKYFLSERKFLRKRWLRKPVEKTLYSLYVLTHKPEVQEINFCQEWEYSINTCVSRSYIITYLLGMLAGHHTSQLLQQFKEERNDTTRKV